MTGVISLERLKREATTAAQTYTSVNCACPYPFQSEAAHAFKAFFLEARRAIEATHYTPKATP